MNIHSSAASEPTISHPTPTTQHGIRKKGSREHALGRPLHTLVTLNGCVALIKHTGWRSLIANYDAEGLDPVMEQYNASLPYDRLFYAQDIAGSIAFARANHNNGILTKDEFAAIEKGFAQIKEEWASDSFEVKDNDEDIHTANERRLSEIIGKEIGGKLHTGRSRNEQVATDMRLWLREELKKLEQFLIQLIKTSVQRAEAEIDVLVRLQRGVHHHS
jgi:argininosuccinate lyase